MTVSAGSLVRCVIKLANANGSQIQNVYDFIMAGTGNADDADVVTGVKNFLEKAYEAVDTFISNDISFTEGLVTLLSFVVDHWESVQALGSFTSIPNIVFDNGNANLPPAAAALIRLRTGVPKHEGRKYIGGLTVDDLDDDGTRTDAFGNALVSMASQLLSGDEAIPDSTMTAQYVVLDANQQIHRYPENAIIPNEIAYQRRRKKYLGV